MTNITEQSEKSLLWPIRALTRRREQGEGSLYRRETRVEAQIEEFSRMGERARQQRLTATGAAWDDTRRPREETLAYFLREYDRRGDEEVAWQIAQALIERTAPHVTRMLGRWRLTPDEADDCRRDLYAQMYEALFDGSATGEFWEVRFWVCLDRRLLNLIERRQKVADAERSPGDGMGESAGDEAEDRVETYLARLTDGAASPEARAEQAEARALLTETEQRAVYLVYVAGLPEESDDPERPSAARLLGVTGRSVRNYLRRAKEKLARYAKSD